MPARPLLVAAMNPCPCGYRGDPARLSLHARRGAALSRPRLGPLLDRFDLHVALPPLSVTRARATRAAASERSTVRARVIAAREYGAHANAARGARPRSTRARRGSSSRAELEPSALRLLHRSMEQLELGLRAYVKVLKVARTIADLERSERVCAAARGRGDPVPAARPRRERVRTAALTPSRRACDVDRSRTLIDGELTARRATNQTSRENAMSLKEKLKARGTAIGAIEKQFGKGAIMALGERDGRAGAGDLDRLARRSTSRSGAAAIRAAASSRSTARSRAARRRSTLHAIAEAQRAGGVAAFIDAEHALDVHYAQGARRRHRAAAGVSQPDTGEQALDIAETLVRSGRRRSGRGRLGRGARAARPRSRATWATRTWACRRA